MEPLKAYIQAHQGSPTSESDGHVSGAPIHSQFVDYPFSQKPTGKTPISSTNSASETSDGACLSTFGSGSSSGVDVNEPYLNSMYRMDRSPHGLAVIINNKSFLPASGVHQYPRKGTDVDRDALVKVFKELNFTTQVHNNKTVKEMEKIFDDLSKKNYSEDDALIVSVLSHGEEGILYATDGIIKIKDMMRWFKGPNLVGKPKIFIFQACQGDEYMDGADTTDAPSSVKYVNKIPVEADFLYAYSTVPGYYSWRNKESGSWFIQSIVKVFEECAETTDLLTMMTRVNAEVAKYQSITNHPSTDGKKQIPSIVSMLTKDFYFYPENILNSNN